MTEGKYSIEEDYTLVHLMPVNNIYKGMTDKNYIPIYVRNDAVDKYHVHRIKDRKRFKKYEWMMT